MLKASRVSVQTGKVVWKDSAMVVRRPVVSFGTGPQRKNEKRTLIKR